MEAESEPMKDVALTSGTMPDVNAGDVPDVNIRGQNVNIWHVEFDGGVGKKELGFVEVVFMLQLRYDECSSNEERMNPQEGIWFYERTAQMRRHFKRQYPEYFAPIADRAARRKRQEKQQAARETASDRRRRGRSIGKVPTARPEVADIQAHRKRERAGG